MQDLYPAIELFLNFIMGLPQSADVLFRQILAVPVGQPTHINAGYDQTIGYLVSMDRDIVVGSGQGMSQDIKGQSCKEENKGKGQGDFSAFRIQKRPFLIFFSSLYLLTEQAGSCQQ